MTPVNANGNNAENAANRRQIPRENDLPELPCHAVVKYLNPMLLGTVAVKYQGRNSDPFQTHPVNMWVYFSAICTYCLVIGMIDQMKDHPISYQDELNAIALISGALSSFALASILLPPLLGWLVFALWALLAFIIARRLLIWILRSIKEGCSRIYQVINGKSQTIVEWFKELPNLPR